MPTFIHPSPLPRRLNRWLKSVIRKSRHARPKPSLEPPRVDLRELPTEIWIIIMRKATEQSTDPLDTSHGVSFLECVPSQRDEYVRCMRIKCNLSLISKAWYRLTQEALYEFVWISCASQAKALAHTLLDQAIVQGVQTSGRWIRRLHIETPFLEMCDPADIRAILDYAPQLIIYSDKHSVRRNRHDDASDPRCSPKQMFSALAHPNSKLRRLSWTNYDDIPFPFHMSPMLQNTSSNLEYLELCSPNLSSICPNSLNTPIIALPALRSLKVTLDNVTFAVLASWDMPQLIHLSVVSSDFNYSGEGFSQFFSAHGPKLIQLELGHSSSSITEHNLTTPPQNPIPLASWCPNLRQFICSADAEWNWQTPDWIPPHVLMPHHPKLELIGIRDIHKRLLNHPGIAFGQSTTDAALFFPLLEQLSSLLRREAFPELHAIRDLSPHSDAMRRNKPQVRVIKFWTRVLRRCNQGHVRVEDCRGKVITSEGLQDALST